MSAEERGRSAHPASWPARPAITTPPPTSARSPAASTADPAFTGLRFRVDRIPRFALPCACEQPSEASPPGRVLSTQRCLRRRRLPRRLCACPQLARSDRAAPSHPARFRAHGETRHWRDPGAGSPPVRHLRWRERGTQLGRWRGCTLNTASGSVSQRGRPEQRFSSGRRGSGVHPRRASLTRAAGLQDGDGPQRGEASERMRGAKGRRRRLLCLCRPRGTP
jgi:hypothetical protein